MGLAEALRVSWRSWLPAVLVVASAVVLFYVLGFLGVYDLAFVLEELPTGVGPAVTSLIITNVAFLLGFGFAIPLGLSRAFPPKRAKTPPHPSPDPTEGGQAKGTASPAATGSAGYDAIRPVRESKLEGPGGPYLPGAGRVLPGATRRAPSSTAQGVSAGLRWALYGFASGYVQAIRGTPFFVQVFIVYFAVIFAFPRLVLLGAPVAFWAGLLALTINTTAYQAEALRGGFQSVDASQIEAGRALGMRRSAIFLRVTLPQAVRLVTLPLANEWISTFKSSAILSVITVVELFYWGRTDIALHFARPLEAFLMLTIFYLVINVSVSRTVTFIEARRRIPGLGTPAPQAALRAGRADSRA